MKVFARERYFVRIKDISEKAIDAIEKKYTFHFFEERACNQCEWVGLRREHGILGECEACAAYRGSALLANKVKLKENLYLATPLGDFEGLCNILKKYSNEDIRKVEKHPVIKVKPIKFTGEARDYQEEAVQACIKGEKGVLYAPPRSGKCIVGSSLIMTKRGITPIKELFPKTREEEYNSFDTTSVSTRSGTKKVLGFYSKIVDNTIRIKDSNGYILEGTPNHKVLVQNKNLEFVWTQLSDLKVGDILVHSRRQQWLCKNHPKIINTCEPTSHQVAVTLPKRLTIELAELLGFWVANGNLNLYGNLSICSHNQTILDRIEFCLKKVFPDLHYRRTSTDIFIHNDYLYNVLSKSNIGLSVGKAKDKAVPDILLHADKQYMDAFLSAYLSCDAWLYNHGIQISSASKKLVYQLQVILSYYGCRSSRKTNKSYARNGSQIKRNYYSLHIARDAQILYDTLYFYKDWNFDTKKNQLDQIFYAYDVLNKLHCRFARLQKGKKYYSINGCAIRCDADTVIHKRFLRHSTFSHSHMDYMSSNQINLETIKKLDKKVFSNFKKVLDPTLFYTQITDITLVNKPRRVYDICVPDTHEYLANSIVSHNTIMLSKMICDLSVKSLIIASQRDWLMGFYETFVGSDTQKALTDLDKSRIGFCKKLADFDKYDICLATVQTFHSESGQVLLKKLRDKFTLVGIDEVHTSSANKYIQEVSRFNCKYKIGLTGTPDRKDGKYVLTEAVVGPVLYEAKVERLRPTIRCVRTHFSDGSKSSIWAYIVRKVESNQARMNLIADWALKDMEAGHMIIIPFTQVKPILKLIEIINQKAGKKVAYPFYGGLKKEVRDETIQKAREYKIKIIVGNMRLLGTGINIPRCSCIFDVTPSANIPMAIQRFSRILTPCEGKPTPIIRYFLDDIEVRRACLRKEFYNVVIKQLGGMMDEKTKMIMDGYLKERSNYPSSLY